MCQIPLTFVNHTPAESLVIQSYVAAVLRVQDCQCDDCQMQVKCCGGGDGQEG